MVDRDENEIGEGVEEGVDVVVGARRRFGACLGKGIEEERANGGNLLVVEAVGNEMVDGKPDEGVFEGVRFVGRREVVEVVVVDDVGD